MSNQSNDKTGGAEESYLPQQQVRKACVNKKLKPWHDKP